MFYAYFQRFSVTSKTKRVVKASSSFGPSRLRMPADTVAADGVRLSAPAFGKGD
jgi:hypothetical protein